jgi:hypothetical protein
LNEGLLREINNCERKYQNRGPTNQKLSDISIDHSVSPLAETSRMIFPRGCWRKATHFNTSYSSAASFGSRSLLAAIGNR